MSPTQSYDVVVAGGGLVGLSLGALLSSGDESIRLLIVEASGQRQYSPDEGVDLRVSALSRASQSVLCSVGVWERVAAIRVSPYRRMRVWDGSLEGRATGRIEFDAAEIGEPNLGHIVENILVQTVLRERLSELGVSIRENTTLSGMSPGDGALQLSLSDKDRIETRLLVAADGVASSTRARLGIRTRDWRHEQTAVVSHVETEFEHQNTALQRFLPRGPLALLPLKDGRSSVVWSTEAAHAEALLQMSSEAFCDALSAASENVLGAIRAHDRRATFPLKSLHALAYTAHRAALIGDAAHAVHPLAGQGVNLGLLDAAALAELILDAIAADQDPGEQRLLRRYERWRKGQNLAMLLGLDGLNRLFSNESPWLGAVRGLGLAVADRSSLAKSFFARRALGLAGDLPRSARLPG